MSIILLLFRNLLLTVLIEGALMLIFTKSKAKTYHSMLVNMLTNPLVNFVLLISGVFEHPINYILLLTLLEISAVITEALLYCKMGDFRIKKAFFASAMLNLCSFSFGAIFL